MKKIVLSIDTSSREKLVIGLEIDGEKFSKEQPSQFHNNQAVLPLIVEILKEHNIVFADLTNIEVNTGPGSFTGLRVGVSIANALSFVLKIPVNGKMYTTGQPLIEPVYAL